MKEIDRSKEAIKRRRERLCFNKNYVEKPKKEVYMPRLVLNTGETLHSFCDKNGYDYSTAYILIKIYGCEPNEAWKYKSVNDYKGFVPLKQQFREKGLEKAYSSVVHYRRKYGLSVEEALQRYNKNTEKRKKRKKYILKSGESLSSFIKRNSIDYEKDYHKAVKMCKNKKPDEVVEIIMKGKEMTDLDIIKLGIINKAKMCNFDLTDNFDKIASAKNRFFGVENWQKCPCDRNSDRGCISKRCMQEIKENGKCHCSLYKIKD